MEQDDITNRFTYHAPDEARAEKHHKIRGSLQNIALYIDSQVPNSREKSLAITKLEEAMFWANAALARN